jgi:hypothetical protein
MKCIQYYEKGLSSIVRISNKKAEQKVDEFKAFYVSKSLWKTNVRDLDKLVNKACTEAAIKMGQEIKDLSWFGKNHPKH